MERLKVFYKTRVANKLSGDSQLVVALVLIAVAIGLCVVFRNQIHGIMINLMTSISNQINNLAAGTLNS